MFGHKNETGAQLYDRFQHRSAISMFMLALAYVIDVARAFVADDLSSLLRVPQLALAILLVLNLLPVVLKVKWVKYKRHPGCNDPDGFVANAFKEASVRGFATGFIALLIVGQASKTYLAHWSTITFVNAVLALMLGVVSISFLMATREPETADEFDVEPDA